MGLRSFAAKLRQDEAAVRAAMIEPWSNGPVEEQVNRLKLIKRSMYGRAKFDLLRQRVLTPREPNQQQRASHRKHTKCG